MAEKWHIKLQARGDWKEYVIPLGISYAEAMETRDACLGEIAIAKPGSLAWCWVGAEAVPEGWPEVTHWDIIARDAQAE